MKRILIFLLCALCVTAGVACGGDSSKGTSNDNSVGAEVGDETMDDIFG